MTSRIPAWLLPLVAVGVATFWVATTAAALGEPGYSWTSSYLSELAARDATHPARAVGGFLASAVAHGAGAYALLRTGRRAAGAALALAALAIVGIAVFRLSGSGPGDVLDTLHAGSVVAYQLALVVAMVAATRRLARRPSAGVVAGSLVAIASTALLVLSLGSGADAIGGPGVAQRTWVALDQLWLLVVAALAVQSARASSPRSSTSSRARVL